NQTPEALEKLGCPVYLVEDHQRVLMVGKVALGVREFHAVRGTLEVEIQRRACVGNLKSKGRFSGLAWPQQCDGGIAVNRRDMFFMYATLNHLCYFGIFINICMLL